MEGIIIKNISNDYTVRVKDCEYICKPRGKFRAEHISPLVGDKVIIDEKNHYLLEILERKNSLVRPPIANIDQAVVVMSIAKPDFSDNLLDKLLTVITFRNVKPVICFTKLDLLKEEEKEKQQNFMDYYHKIGYEVYENNDITALETIFKAKTTVFTGQSGAGKSTLLNKLNAELDLKTDEISKALGRGKHTTRHVELLNVADGLIADTPGFSSLELLEMKPSDIRDSFIEFDDYKSECKYHNCMHDKEDNCAVKREVGINILESRYENYIKFIHGGKQ